MNKHSLSSLPVDVLKNIFSFIEVEYDPDQNKAKKLGKEDQMGESTKDSTDFISSVVKKYFGKHIFSGYIFFLFPFRTIAWSFDDRQELLLVFPLIASLNHTLSDNVAQILLRRRDRKGGIPTRKISHFSEESKEEQHTKNMKSFIETYFTKYNISKHISRLDIRHVELTSDVFVCLIKHLPFLKEISLGIVENPRKKVRMRCIQINLGKKEIEAINSLGQLESLNWCGNGISHDTFHLFTLPLIKHFHCQSHLSLGTFYDLLKKWKYLETLEIRQGFKFISNSNATINNPEIFTLLNECPNFKALSLYGEKCVDGFEKLCNQSIMYLDLSSCRLNSKSIIAIGKLQNLRVLILSSADGFASSDLEYLVPLKNSLQFLDLSNISNCTNDTCKYIGEITSLRRLSLKNCIVDDTNKRSPSLENLVKLEQIDLSYTKVGAESIRRLVQKCPNLKHIVFASINKYELAKLSTKEKALFANGENLSMKQKLQKYCM